MAINLIPFDSTKPMSDAKASTSPRNVDQTSAPAKIRNEAGPPKAVDSTIILEPRASKPNRRKRKASKQESQQDDFGLYTNKQTADHHLITESLEDDEHQLDIQV